MAKDVVFSGGFFFFSFFFLDRNSHGVSFTGVQDEDLESCGTFKDL